MGLECGECERDLRGGHDSECSRYVKPCDECLESDYCDEECLCDCHRYLKKNFKVNDTQTAADEGIPKYEQNLDQLFVDAFETNHPAMLDYALLKMELKRLRFELAADTEVGEKR